nr:uncharacterized protein LOC100181841 isoform X3 [Ciona intestinalis]|eukprot:XP_026693099.1 uncharacterized protein LOC100181841 isoform X3 [Ciona intestinalis]
MRWQFGFVFILDVSLIVCCGATRSTISLDSWSTWSSCSVTCGSGVATRRWKCSGINCEQKVETKPCFPEFCPSYMTWPRLHYSGTIVYDANTVNNKRCNFDIENYPNIALKIKEKTVYFVNKTIPSYKFQVNNWNPDGSGHVYFMNTTIKSICTGPLQCSTTDTIVGSVFKDTSRGQLATIDVDFQVTSEIWGLAVEIPGVLKAKYLAGADQQKMNRIPHHHYDKKLRGYAYNGMARLKSKLVDLQWSSSYYKQLFRNATELSVTIVIDLYNHFSFSGRVAGVIGLTSDDDPKETSAGRMMKSQLQSLPAPFFVNYKHKIITLDLSSTLTGREDGTFITKGYDIGFKINCRFPLVYATHICQNKITTKKGESVSLITTNGSFSSLYLDEAGRFYKVFAGIVDVDISHMSTRDMNLLKYHEVVIVQKHNDQWKIVIGEFSKGVQVGIFSKVQLRLNLGQSKEYVSYISRFNKPLPNTQVNIEVCPANAAVICGQPSCKLPLSTPRDALKIEALSPLTNSKGLITHKLTAVKSPNGLRGCGLDGQLYMMKVQADVSIGGQMHSYLNGYFCGSKSTFYETVLWPLVRIYDETPVPVCPTWMDVRGIFTQYYNLYPVMWKNGIINLRSYDDVRRRERMLKAAMFETDFSNSKYMPASRDLSLSKQKLIWNWMQCGMKYGNETRDALDPDICSPSKVNENLIHLKKLLQKAVFLELTTIPPYFTAWLSLQTEYARNLKVANVLKSIYTEEMLHMSLAANFLNSIGGTVKLADMWNIPIYPTQLAEGGYYDVAPQVLVALKPFSIGYVKDVFMKVEKPSPAKERNDLFEIVGLWKMLPTASGDQFTNNMDQLIKEYETQYQDVSDNHETLDATEKLQLLQKWHAVKQSAARQLKPSPNPINTVGSLYTQILSKTILLESCAKIDGLNNKGPGTIFVGDPIKQLNMSYWYNPVKKSKLEETAKFWSSEMSKEELVLNERQTSFKIKRVERDSFPPGSDLVSPLFPITDLKSAIQGVVEIIYQGEGGSPCSPFKSAKPGGTLSLQTSHYVKFMEIVHGRTLVQMKRPSVDSGISCLNLTLFDCPNKLKSDEAFCFAGDEIAFYEDGVWPIVSNPTPTMYKPGTDAHHFNHQFNIQYTRLLFCLESAFGGNPSKMRSCMSYMYDLIITGKRLVRSPVGVTKDTFITQPHCSNCHATPTWDLLRDIDQQLDLPLAPG